MKGSEPERRQHYKVVEVVEDPAVLAQVNMVGRAYGAHVVVLAPIGGMGTPVTADEILEVSP